MKQIIRLITLSLLLIAPLTTISTHAQDSTSDTENKVKIRVLAERGLILPDEEIWIGIEQSITPHWHTYWKNPGDSGAAPNIKWTLPEGFEISEIYWPTPKKIPYEPLLNYGYENNVILLQKLKAPATLPDGELTLKVDIDVLVCKDTCIPEYAEQTLTLNANQSFSEDNAAYLGKAASRLPQKVSWDATFKDKDGNLELTIIPSNMDVFDTATPEIIDWIPTDWGMIDNPSPPKIWLADKEIIITQKRGERALTDIKESDILLTIGKGENRSSYQMRANQTIAIIEKDTEQSTTPTETEQEQEQEQKSETTLITALILALFGGIVLNLMPCVFPVLSLKAISLVKIAEKNPAQAKKHGLAYTAGVILSFLFIAGALLVLKAAGAQIGWGFQLQNPIIVGTLAYLLFVIGLNLFGFFEFGSSFTNIGANLTKGQGYKASFFTGILATVVATPCTAPFMATAIGYAALNDSVFINLSIFAALGFGLALPYLILSFSPKLEKIMPKPGAWMNTFKQAMAFPMFLSAAGLVWVLSRQSTEISVLLVLLGMVMITFALWLTHVAKSKKPTKAIAITIILGALALLTLAPEKPTEETVSTESMSNWEMPYSPAALDEALQGSEPIFVEMTADWCITCKVNHATSINTNATKTLFKEENVQFFVGDWTNQDAQITKYLKSHGRGGVPLYVFYGSPDETGQRPEAKLLPQILTPKIVETYIKGEN